MRRQLPCALKWLGIDDCLQPSQLCWLEAGQLQDTSLHPVVAAALQLYATVELIKKKNQVSNGLLHFSVHILMFT